MVFDPNVPDLAHYTQEMLKPLLDKMFFLDKVCADTHLFVDYGCADGVMAGPLKMFLPHARYIGFDLNPEMLAHAKAQHPDGMFTNTWAEVEAVLSKTRMDGQKTCVILNSLIHEVYAYLSPPEIQTFWDRIWGRHGQIGFDTVSIRDMMLAHASSRPSDPLSVSRVRQIFAPAKIQQWEQQWGTLHENWSLVHFLLTYRYEANWERELRENYFPMALEQFFSLVPREFSAIYAEHYCPPFMRRSVKADFGITLSDPTHLKILFERS